MPLMSVSAFSAWKLQLDRQGMEPPKPAGTSWASIALASKDLPTRSLIRSTVISTPLDAKRCSSLQATAAPSTGHQTPILPILISLPARSSSLPAPHDHSVPDLLHNSRHNASPAPTTSLTLTLQSLTESMMAPLRAFADRTFPVRYDAPFFERALLARGLSLLLLDTRGAVGPPRVVAALLARKEPVTAHGVYDVYLAVLGVDAGLRRRGVASMLLRRLVDKCEAEADGWMRGFVLHVHVGNEGARRLYEANGFRVVGTIVGYYRDNAKVAEPRDAYYLRRDKGAFEIA